jgi:P4 family phage/plasmid primase-like protien
MPSKSEIIKKANESDIRNIIYTKNYSDYHLCQNYLELIEIIKKNKCIYEFISEKSKVNMFFDIECPTDHSIYKNQEDLVFDVKTKVQKEFPDYNKKFIVLEAHNHSKWSFHIILRMTDNKGNPVILKNVQSCKQLYNKFLFNDKKVFDFSVYREGLFRTIDSSKPREKRPFILSELSDPVSDLQETFVCYITENTDILPIELDYTKTNTNTNTSKEELQVLKRDNQLTELSNDDKHEIRLFIRSYYKHNPNYIREILIDTKFNCVVVSLNERYCEFVKREHKSNHQYIILDLLSAKQKCHDMECEKQIYNEIQFYHFPENLQNVLKKVLILNNNEMISEAVECAKTFINDKFDNELQLVTFDKNEMMFRGEASQILNRTIRGRCSHCKAEHQISSTGYCLKCNTCQTTFPKDLMIPIDHQTSSVLGKFWTFINNGTVNNNNITIINQNNLQEDFTCDVQLDNSIFKNKELTKLLNQILDGHKVVLISQLMSQLDDDFKYTNGEWYHFNGSIWKADKESLEFRKHIVKLSNHFNKIQKFYESKKTSEISENFSIIKNVKSLINKLHKTGFEDEVIKGAKMYYYDEYFISKLNSKKHLVPFSNGVYDLLSNKYRNTTKEDYINLTVSYNYDISVQNPEVYTFLEQVLPKQGVRDFVLKKMSECLNGDIPNTNFLMFIGDSGANGKSQLLNLMKLTMGDFGEKVEVTLLTRKRNNANEANTEKMKLMHKRFAFLSEPEDGEKINIGLLKELTGSEEIVARGLYQDSMSFVMEAKLFLACNELPEIKGEDTALWRRIRVIDFPSRFVDNPQEENEYPIDRTLPSRMREDITWRQTFMNILLSYYHKTIPEPNEIKLKTNEYRQENNDFYNWLEENIEYKEGDVIQLKDICQTYLGKTKVHSSLSTKFRKEIEKYIKEKYKNVKWEFQHVWVDDKSVRGWKDLQLKC